MIHGKLTSYTHYKCRCSECKSGWNKYQKSRRDSNIARTRAEWRKYAVASRAKVSEILRSVKDVPCYDCGVKYPYYVMDFDHVQGEKSFNIGTDAVKFSREQLIEEMAKCEVVCANCHRERTHRRKTT